MIIRRDSESLLFITQPDHARLAAEAIAHWRADGLDAHPRRATILFAVREHDNGWIEEDETTYVDEAGQPLDFVSVPLDVRHRIWPRGVDRLGRQDAYAAALVAQHALTVHRQMHDEAPWRTFFDAMAARRAALLERCGVMAARTLEADYAFVNAADRLSLAFCTGWTQPLESHGRRIILRHRTVEVSPDPFEGTRVQLRVPARRLPDRRYRSSAELRAALDDTPIESLEGFAAGPVVNRP